MLSNERVFKKDLVAKEDLRKVNHDHLEFT